MCKDQYVSDIEQHYIATPTQEQEQHQQQDENEQQQELQQAVQLIKIIKNLFSASTKNYKRHHELNEKLYNEVEVKLALDGLRQNYLKLNEIEKNKKLIYFINKLKFNKLIIFVETSRHAAAVRELLTEQNIPAAEIHHRMPEEERFQRCKAFKECKTRILVATDSVGFRMDFIAIDIVFIYDMSEDADTYFHRVVGAGRLGTNGLAITFIANENDAEVLKEVQNRFKVEINEMPNDNDTGTATQIRDQ